MKKTFLSGLAIVSLTTLSTPVAFHQRSLAQSYDSTTFYCGTSNDHPATIVHNPQIGHDVVIIEWISQWSDPKWTPERRCQEVSRRFQNYFNDGSLQLIKGGWWNNEPVLCVADPVSGSCKGLLYTLKKGSDPVEAVGELMKLHDHPDEYPKPIYNSSPVIYYKEDSNHRNEVFINWKGFIAVKRSMSIIKP